VILYAYNLTVLFSRQVRFSLRIKTHFYLVRHRLYLNTLIIYFSYTSALLSDVYGTLTLYIIVKHLNIAKAPNDAC